MNIELIYVPISGTDKFQPMDKRIFGILKLCAASEFSQKAFETHEGYTKPEAADLFVKYGID